MGMSAYDTYIRRLNKHFRDYVESDPDLFAGLLVTDESTVKHPTVFKVLHLLVTKQNLPLMTRF
jgi:hypothetical protein